MRSAERDIHIDGVAATMKNADSTPLKPRSHSRRGEIARRVPEIPGASEVKGTSAFLLCRNRVRCGSLRAPPAHPDGRHNGTVRTSGNPSHLPWGSPHGGNATRGPVGADAARGRSVPRRAGSSDPALVSAMAKHEGSGSVVRDFAFPALTMRRSGRAQSTPRPRPGQVGSVVRTAQDDVAAYGVENR